MHHKTEIVLNEKPLYKLSYEFCFSKTQSESEAKFFAKLMEKLFNSHEHEMVTISSNLIDGIGDYASHVYFIEKLTNLTAEYKNIHLKNISFVSKDKQSLAKIVRENKISEESVFTFGKKSLNQDYIHQQHSFGCLIYNRKKLSTVFLKQRLILFSCA